MIIILTMLLLFSCSGKLKTIGKTINSPAQFCSKQQLREDFEQLINIIYTNHPRPFAYVSRKDFDDLVKQQSRLIKNEMNEEEFLRVLYPVIAKIKCGHSSIQPSYEYQWYQYKYSRLLPLDIKIIDNKAYVIKNFSSNDNLLPGFENS